MITEKTVFINKKFEKFHSLTTKAKNKHTLIFYKYKNYYFEAGLNDSLKVFELLYFFNKYQTRKQSLNNFEIQTIFNEDCYKDKQNDNLNIYFNKYQILFFCFLHHGLKLLQDIDQKKQEDLEKLEKKLKLQLLNHFKMKYSEKDLVSKRFSKLNNKKELFY